VTTNELETLLFLALARATCQYLEVTSNDVSVYGDDIIIPVEAVPLFTEVLAYSGFTVNQEKSFSVGPFRESCGSDFFLGVDVRPVFIRRELSAYTWILLLNGLTRKDLDLMWPKTWAAILELIPGRYRKFNGPDDGTDGHIVRRCHWLIDHGLWGRDYRSFQFSPSKTKVAKDGWAYFIDALYQAQFLTDQNTNHFNALRPFTYTDSLKDTGLTAQAASLEYKDEFGNLSFRNMMKVRLTKQRWEPERLLSAA